MFDVTATGLVMAGAGLLLSAHYPARRLLAQLPLGAVRTQWKLLSLMVMVFVAGYFIYATLFWGSHSEWIDLVVPVIFFLGAWFVWITLRLSLRTALDIRRVAVLERENITDPLTGIYNRRYMDQRLEAEIAWAHRHATPLSILLLDIDHFKSINDTHGHCVGDRVLSHVGGLVLAELRQTDVAARYGGDELVVITPNTMPDAAVVLADRIRKHVEAHPLVSKDRACPTHEIRITVSVGVAGLSPQVSNGQALIGLADAALYRAKNAGRNRVVAETVAT